MTSYTNYSNIVNIIPIFLKIGKYGTDLSDTLSSPSTSKCSNFTLQNNTQSHTERFTSMSQNCYDNITKCLKVNIAATGRLQHLFKVTAFGFLQACK